MRSSCTAISKNLENGGNKAPFMRVEADYCIPFFRKPKRRTAAARGLCFTDPPRQNEGAKRPPILFILLDKNVRRSDGTAAARGCRFSDPLAFHYPRQKDTTPTRAANASQKCETNIRAAAALFSLMAKRTVKPYRVGA